MSFYTDSLNQLTYIEQYRVDIIDALREVGVAVDSSAKLEDLPELILKIGGTDTTGFPVNMNSIGYNNTDSYRASFRYMCRTLVDNEKKYLDLGNLKNQIQVELGKSLLKLNEWNAKTTAEKEVVTDVFNGWDGAFPPMFDTSICTKLDYWFYGADFIVHLPLYDTSNVLGADHPFDGEKYYLHEVPDFDFQKVRFFDTYRHCCYAYIFGIKNAGLPKAQGDSAPPPEYGGDGMSAMCLFEGLGMGGGWWKPCPCAIVKYTVYPTPEYTEQRVWMNGSGGLTLNSIPNIATSLDMIQLTNFPYYDVPLEDGGAPNGIGMPYNSMLNVIDDLYDVSSLYGRGRIITEQEREEDSYILVYTPCLLISRKYYNLVLTQADKNNIFNKGWNIYYPPFD